MEAKEYNNKMEGRIKWKEKGSIIIRWKHSVITGCCDSCRGYQC